MEGFFCYYQKKPLNFYSEKRFRTKESPFYTSGLPFAIGTYDANRSFKEVEFFKATISKSAHEFLINQDAMKLYDLKNNGVAKAVYDC